MNSVCLVGNSSQLIGRTLGEQIDAHDVVMRFNRWRESPADVGFRCTHWGVGLWRGLLEALEQHGPPPGAKTVDEIWAATVAGRDALEAPEWAAFCRHARDCHVRRIHYRSLRRERLAELTAAGLTGKRRWPSTGLLMLAAALDRWPGRIDVCGFWDGEHRGEYWAPRRDVIAERAHWYDGERRLIDLWCEVGRVRRIDG